MRRARGTLRTIVSAIGLVIAVSTAIFPPIGYFSVVRSNLDTTLSFEARLKANRLAKYIYAHTEIWQYQRVRLAEIIEVPEAEGTGYQQRVLDSEGKLVLETGETPDFPVATISAPIIVSGLEVGRVHSAASFRPQLLGSGLVALFSALLGSAMFFALRVLPLKVLDRTLGELDAQTLRFESALENMSQGLCMFDAESRLVVSNRRFSQLFGIAPKSIRRGMSEHELMVLSDGQMSPSSSEGDMTSVMSRANGNIISVLRQPMANGGAVITYEDVTERRQAEAKIAHMARHDALTGLPNRLLFNEQLQQALNWAGEGEALAVLCLDIDNFKVVNDTLGHGAGDALLLAITDRIQGAIREGDTAARLGGDEFAIVQTQVASPASVTALAVRLVELMAAPFDLNGHQVVVGTSIGIALGPTDGDDPQALLKNADLALYRAKAEGRGRYRYFETAMDAQMQFRRALETDLRKASAQGEFQLFYQPIVDISTETILGFEGLLRWRRPGHGMVQPDSFIPLAEETGLIIPMGEWVIAEACKQAVTWPGDTRIAVNLSPVQLKSAKLVAAVETALASTGLSPGRLELEITESVLLQDDGNTMSTLHQLRALGVRISMDDFGTGYSSLSYLRKFPFDKIKIDRSFIREMSDRDDSLAIVRAVSAIGESLGMKTTAEGVETREQFDRVKREGCTEVQGYLFSPPIPASDLPALFAKLTPTQRDGGQKSYEAVADLLALPKAS